MCEFGYWDATDAILRANGGVGPKCPFCGEPMFPADDHGRFSCFCQGFNTFDAVTGMMLPRVKIPQVDTTGMTNEQKAAIPGINRMASTPTEAEAKLMSLLLKGPDVMDTQEYWDARKAVEEERQKAQ